MSRVIVVGGGAAGLMAAYAARTNGCDVTLLERNEKLGKKIYITGKGRCNVTNNCEPEEFFNNVVNGKNFLKGAIYNFPPSKLMEFLEEHGLRLKTERGNRVFPSSDHASDVTKTFERALNCVGVEIKLNTRVENIAKQGDIFSVHTNNGIYESESVIICTGGMSYPTTGSTGDGYKFAESFSHKITELKPGLCGLNIKGDFYKELQGLSLKNVALSARVKDKQIYSDFGEMLFTHFGVSGPLVISLSSMLVNQNINDVILKLDLKPALSYEQLDKRVLRDFEKYKNKQLFNALIELLPSKLIDIVIKKSNIDGKKAVNAITKEERERLVKTLKEFEMRPYGFRGFEEAIITVGGVDLKSVNSRTMESKLCENLYFAGEVLNLDAYTGGFNLQIAFSTGYAAGSSVKV